MEVSGGSGELTPHVPACSEVFEGASDDPEEPFTPEPQDKFEHILNDTEAVSEALRSRMRVIRVLGGLPWRVRGVGRAGTVSPDAALAALPLRESAEDANRQ